LRAPCDPGEGVVAGGGEIAVRAAVVAPESARTDWTPLAVTWDPDVRGFGTTESPPFVAPADPEDELVIRIDVECDGRHHRGKLRCHLPGSPPGQ
jgi:hypothetical protein